MPSWTGKALGAAAALVFAPASPTALLWWLTAAIAVGHGLDWLGALLGQRSMTDRAGNPRPGGRSHNNSAGQPASRASLRFTFAALGSIAAAAGTPGSAQRQYADRLMQRLAFTPERRREALAWFRAGADAAFPFDTLAAACREDFARHPVLKELAMQSLCRMAAVSDTPRATARLLNLGERLGWDRGLLAAQAVAVAAFIPQRGPVECAREMLGVRDDDSAEVIRLAYRRRVARWHPDRLPPEATEEERAVAEDRMWRLRESLDTLLG